MRLRVINHEKFKTVSIGILIRRGLKIEEATLNALLAGVLKQGCARYRNLRAINICLDNMYGAIFQCDIMKKGEEQLIEFYIEVLNKKGLVNEAFNFLNEMMCFPFVEDGGFKKEYVEVAKNNLKNIIADKINDKREYAKDKCIELMCENEPYSVSADGYIEDLKNIDGKKLYEHYKNIIANSPIEIFAVGDIKKEDILKKANEMAVDLNQNIDIEEAEYRFEPTDRRVFEEKMDIAQGKLCVGLRLNVEPVSIDYYKALIANEVLGGSANSRLFSTLREGNSLCYYINSYIYRFKSIMLIQAGIENESFEKAVEMIEKALEDIKKNGITQGELKSAKLNVKNRYRALMDYPSNLMDYYLGQAILNDKDDIESVIKNIEAIEDIDDVLENCFLDTVYFLRGE